MAAKPIPDGYHNVTPYLLVQGAEKLIDFLTQAFGAQEMLRMPGPNGSVMHAEVRIGDSVVMMGQPGDGAAMPAALYLYLDNVDAVYKRALEAGGTSTEEPADQPYGDRRAGIKDPCGNTWWIATHIKDMG
jgi:PhnB protein